MKSNWQTLQELEQFVYIGRRRPRSHFWVAETMMEYLSFLEEEIRERRRMLKLSHQHTCLVIADSASQHSSHHFQAFKEEWRRKMNVILLTGDSTGDGQRAVPGGFGAAGAPNDGWHQFHHALTRTFALSTFSWRSAFDNRKSLDQLQHSVQGSLSTRCLIAF